MKTVIAALIAALATPALGQEWSTVEFMARDLKKNDPVKAYRGAVAACLAGQGDTAKTADLFEKAGWTVTADAEMGLTEIGGPVDGIYVLTANDGSFCAAYSEIQGTDTAIGNLQIVSGAGGFRLNSAASDMGCDAYTLAPGILAEITSSGNDPACTDGATSQVRFTFGQGQ